MIKNYKSIEETASAGIRKAVVAIGVFDGVHCGHKKLLSELLRMSRELKASPVVLTFYPHPRSLLSKEPPMLLYPPEEKVRLLYESGVEAVVTLNFTKEFASLSPESFLDQIFSTSVEISGICVGQHWRFGAGAAGNVDFLKKEAEEKHFLFSAVDEFCSEDGTTVSSTLIRAAVSRGDLQSAEKMLGRRYSFYGYIEHGYQVAAEKLDTPTANLKIKAGVLPLFGVYAAWVRLDRTSERYSAAVNIGVSPTFREQYGRIAPRIEVHLLNGFSGDLYGRFMELELAGFVRSERIFASPEELKKQITDDIQTIQTLLKRRWYDK